MLEALLTVIPVKVMKWGMKLRDLELRMILYEEVRRLRAEGKTYSQIQRIIYERHGEWLSKSIISYWCRRCHTPDKKGLGRPREDQRLNRITICSELAYVIGAKLGDGYEKLEGEYRYTIVLAVKDYDFAEEFGRCAAITFGRDRPYKPRWDKYLKRWVVKVRSKALYEILRKPIDMERIRPYIEHYEKSVVMFIRGLADAESDVGKDGRIRIYNTNKLILEYAAELLAKPGIHSKIYNRKMNTGVIIKERYYLRRKSICYVLQIHQKISIMRFKDLIGSSIKRKQIRLGKLNDA
ncbi:hypothetical protein HRbin02_01889 [Candidatus Calditenuaceae archaeon HR02]|nr:hypothetical protein HRbin02_01889 [Candidatus Calditenuaceae archaeon HR02]